MIAAFDELVCGPLRRTSAAAEKIGGKVLQATKILEEAFAAEKDLLIRAKKCQSHKNIIKLATFSLLGTAFDLSLYDESRSQNTFDLVSGSTF